MSHAAKENARGELAHDVAPVPQPRREPRQDAGRRDRRDAGRAGAEDLSPSLTVEGDATELPSAHDGDDGQVTLSVEMRDAFRRFRASPLGSRSARVGMLPAPCSRE